MAETEMDYSDVTVRLELSPQFIADYLGKVPGPITSDVFLGNIRKALSECFPGAECMVLLGHPNDTGYQIEVRDFDSGFHAAADATLRKDLDAILLRAARS